jgi:uncharacterized protein
MFLKSLDLNLKAFVPYSYVWTGHSQTVLGHILQSKDITADFKKEVLTLPDQDQVLVEYFKGSVPFTLSLYHGLGGHARADYMCRAANIAIELGWNVVLVNHRAASSLAYAKKSYHSGRGEDAEFIIEWSRTQFPNTKQVAVGFSMSGSILLNLLSLRNGKKQPDYAVVVNAPLDLAKASWKLTEGFCKIYDYRFYRILKSMIEEREKMNLPWLGRTIDIDQLYTAPVNQFKNRDDYYAKCSTKKYVDQIKTPTFILTAEDDPFIDVTDYRSAAWTNCVHLTVNRYGGHMGYFSKSADPKYGRRWLDHYLRSVFEKIQII